tara:strand:- start:418 stop:552 length:135 start_codon:yes stop_codon:yes gene_type:complete
MRERSISSYLAKNILANFEFGYSFSLNAIAQTRYRTATQAEKKL